MVNLFEILSTIVFNSLANQNCLGMYSGNCCDAKEFSVKKVQNFNQENVLWQKFWRGSGQKANCKIFRVSYFCLFKKRCNITKKQLVLPKYFCLIEFSTRLYIIFEAHSKFYWKAFVQLADLTNHHRQFSENEFGNSILVVKHAINQPTKNIIREGFILKMVVDPEYIIL